MQLALTIAALALIQQSGCDFSGAKPAKTVAPRAPSHRFVLPRVPTDDGVAIDTPTGKICKTWAWSPIGKAPNPDPNTGGTPQRLVGEFAPTCLSLYEKYPSGIGDGSVTVTAAGDQ